MKCVERGSVLPSCGRSPCGERGLKLQDIVDISQEGTSLPVRGAWIEMCHVNIAIY